MTTVDDLLAAARARLDRLDPRRAAELVAEGALLVDTRPGWQRAHEGDAARRAADRAQPPGVAAGPDHRTPASREAIDHDVRWIVVCSEGYTSSLAAASLQDLGLHNATDLAGGFQGWKAAGLPVG